MIALLCSVNAEADILLPLIDVSRSSAIGSKMIVEGTVSDQQVLLCVGGMGKVNAGHAATLLLDRFDPEVIISFGIGGAYPSSGARIGDIALAQEEIAGDEGVLTLDGFKDTEYIGIPLLKTASAVIYTTYPAPTALLKQALHSLVSRPHEGNIHVGKFVTLSTCTGTASRARELEERHHGLCENMEGAAVAQVAMLHNLPWLEVRGISNMVEDRDPKKWDISRATAAVQNAVLTMLAGWRL